MNNVYYTGFAMPVEVDLEVGGSVIQDPSQIAPVTAALVKIDRSGLATTAPIVTCTFPGGTAVRATWSAAQTLTIPPGSYLVEFRTADGPFCHEGIKVDLLAGVSP